MRCVGTCEGVWECVQACGALPLLYYFTPPNYWLKSFTPTGECEIRIPNSKVTQWINILKRILVFILLFLWPYPAKWNRKFSFQISGWKKLTTSCHLLWGVSPGETKTANACLLFSGGKGENDPLKAKALADISHLHTGLAWLFFKLWLVTTLNSITFNIYFYFYCYLCTCVRHTCTWACRGQKRTPESLE